MVGAPVELQPPLTHRQSIPHSGHSQRRRTIRQRSNSHKRCILHSHVLCPLQRDEHIRRHRRISLPTGNFHPTTVQRHALGPLRQEFQAHPHASPALPPVSQPSRSQRNHHSPTPIEQQRPSLQPPPTHSRLARHRHTTTQSRAPTFINPSPRAEHPPSPTLTRRLSPPQPPLSPPDRAFPHHPPPQEPDPRTTLDPLSH